MTPVVHANAVEPDLDLIATFEGDIVVFADLEGKLDLAAKRVNRLTRGALKRFVESDDFEKLSAGDAKSLNFLHGLTATTLIVGKIGKREKGSIARDLGGKIASASHHAQTLILSQKLGGVADLAEGMVLAKYAYVDQKSEPEVAEAAYSFMSDDVAAAQVMLDLKSAIAQGVFFTRDLTNAPANVLTTTEFANQLADMQSIGLKVEVLEEAELEKLGMRTLLSVGQGSDSPSKVVVMQWNGGGEEAPFALVGKGVVFDTGGISLKPAAGMEDMTMDMGGAGVVSGVMKTLALRGAKANVVGVVGLVENMPSGNATRPGDVVKSMKGDTVEIINTDAEGRLVLADILWYTQDRFAPTGMINLATLTGAIIIGLGHEKAGVFSNSDALSKEFLKAAENEGEGAWRMPLDPAYDKLIKSDIADIKNVGGRAAGSITAAQFLQRFVKDDMPWAHLDIAGVASLASATSLSPKGATGWGVRALNRIISDHYEG